MVNKAHEVARSAGHWKRKLRTPKGARAEARAADGEAVTRGCYRPAGRARPSCEPIRPDGLLRSAHELRERRIAAQRLAHAPDARRHDLANEVLAREEIGAVRARRRVAGLVGAAFA